MARSQNVARGKTELPPGHYTAKIGKTKRARIGGRSAIVTTLKLDNKLGVGTVISDTLFARPSPSVTFTKALRHGAFDELPHKRGAWVVKCGEKNCLGWVAANTGNEAADGFVKLKWKYIVNRGWCCRHHQN